MKKDTFYVGVRFDKDKELFYKLKNNSLRSSDLIRKSLYQYFRSKESNQRLDLSGSIDANSFTILSNQISFLQKQIEFLQSQNAFLSLPWYKKIIYQLESKHE